MGRPRKNREPDFVEPVGNEDQEYKPESEDIPTQELLNLISQIIDALYRNTKDIATWKPLSDKVEELRKKLMV